ncbi:type II toxin-antitoxin system mRNA interferase toxin, RelE/StbE family [Patescibacteria group bacterium]|nr:type II toxin-antitoxin system mRNA interferase toxin, RelE/StbE family [Patescibacteria group bacterium]MBU1016509.1 type II toxin-antitoxin system mRNA interferase toxin, RelE/StbE family [Patescibacteria group bacterium]MBU1685112.1 type II toxin-antitoxin system mRNA interferase toxin, RelE/StbE family [Patescibacteria group bacterium]MBU1938612.1 type II toxin-antitoxin system mRNA interferase toxin, RelE/StbE family [Patescibacteria group bacterium]
MIEVEYNRDFLKDFKKLPKNIRKKLGELEEIFRENPFHPELHSKGLHGKLRDFYSFRITRDYRVVYLFTDENKALFLLVGHRKDIYKKI